MKWFKHQADSGDDTDIHDAVDLFGTDGYYVFYRTLEIMTKKFDPKNPAVCEFSVSFLKKSYHISWKKLEKILAFYHKAGRFSFYVTRDAVLPMVTLMCPELKALCDEYTAKVLKKKSKDVGTVSGQCQLQELEGEVEGELEVDIKNKSKSKSLEREDSNHTNALEKTSTTIDTTEGNKLPVAPIVFDPNSSKKEKESSAKEKELHNTIPPSGPPPEGKRTYYSSAPLTKVR